MMAVAFCGLASGDAGSTFSMIRSAFGTFRSLPQQNPHSSYRYTLLHHFPIEDDNTRRRNSKVLSRIAVPGII
jgi:hypothetical protein